MARKFLITMTTGNWDEPDEIYTLASEDTLEAEVRRCAEDTEGESRIDVWERTAVEVVSTGFEVRGLDRTIRPTSSSRRPRKKKHAPGKKNR